MPGRPARAEAQACLDAVLTAVDPGDGPTELQQLLIEAAFASMTGHDVTRTMGASVDPADLSAVLADRDEAFRTRILQMMILGALVLRPLPPPVADPALAERWAAFEHLPAGTLGRRMWEFYRARGFIFPGLPGSAPPLLAQHDFVHVLGDYGTRVESELEVFAFIARANDDPKGFSLLAMVVSLFETGYLATGAGISPYQWMTAQEQAAALGQGYDSYGARP